MNYLLRVPENSTGSCGIMAIRFRRSLNRSFAVSIPSIKIWPSTQANRKTAPMSELLPAPVRPTIPLFDSKFDEIILFRFTILCFNYQKNCLPIFSFGLMTNDKSRITGSASSKYRKNTFRNSIFPCVGQVSATSNG